MRLVMVQAFVPMIIDRPCLKDLVMLFLASYIFLLRLPRRAYHWLHMRHRRVCMIRFPCYQ